MRCSFSNYLRARPPTTRIRARPPRSSGCRSAVRCASKVPVVRSPPAESDAYFATRPTLSQLNAWSSARAAPLAEPAQLPARTRKKRHASSASSAAPRAHPLPRPAYWGGYRLWFETVELWAEGAHRFHERTALPARSRSRRRARLSPRRLERRASATVTRTPALLIQRETVTCPYCWQCNRDYGRSLGGRPDLCRGLLRLL